jgi:DNA-binding NarL/FixJ family response regulator
LRAPLQERVGGRSGRILKYAVRNPFDYASWTRNSNPYPRLSQREFDVLEQIARGKSNKEIGQLLYLSEHTVKNYVKAILKKLNASGRTEAIATAVRRGLITME